MKTLISVTQDHIDAGRHSSAFACPIALAVKDATKMHWDRAITVNHVDIKGWTNAPDPKVLWTNKCPKEAAAFQFALDAGDPVEPIEFYLDI